MANQDLLGPRKGWHWRTLCTCYKIIQCGCVDAPFTPVLWHVGTYRSCLGFLPPVRLRFLGGLAGGLKVLPRGLGSALLGWSWLEGSGLDRGSRLASANLRRLAVSLFCLMRADCLGIAGLRQEAFDWLART